MAELHAKGLGNAAHGRSARLGGDGPPMRHVLLQQQCQVNNPLYSEQLIDFVAQSQQG